MPLLNSYPFENWESSETSGLSQFVWPSLFNMVGLSFMCLFNFDKSFYDIMIEYYGQRNA